VVDVDTAKKCSHLICLALASKYQLTSSDPIAWALRTSSLGNSYSLRGQHCAVLCKVVAGIHTSFPERMIRSPILEDKIIYT
jgi:hypothetical protein